MKADKSDLFQGGLFQPGPEEFTQLPAKALTLWRIQTLINNAVMALITGSVLGLLMPWWLEWDPKWAGIAAIWPLWALRRWFALKIKWRFTGYRLGDEEIHLRYGLMERSGECFPYGRIQLTEVTSGFWSRRLGLAYVSISIGARARSGIGPVETAEAARLRDELTELTRSKAVEL